MDLRPSARMVSRTSMAPRKPSIRRWITAFSVASGVALSAAAQDGSEFSLNDLLIPGENWSVVANSQSQSIVTITADRDGTLYYNGYAEGARGIYRLERDGSGTRINALEQGAMVWTSGGLIGTDGDSIYALRPAPRMGTPFAPFRIEVLAHPKGAWALCASANGFVYFTDLIENQVRVFDPRAGQTVNLAPLRQGGGIALSPDGDTLVAASYGEFHADAFRVEPNGRVSGRGPFLALRTFPHEGEKEQRMDPRPLSPYSGAHAICTDREGRYYVAMRLGVQVFDSEGREIGLIAHPAFHQSLVGCTVAGSSLYVCAGPTVYRRRINAKGWTP
jgi:gluconolactonase